MVRAMRAIWITASGINVEINGTPDDIGAALRTLAGAGVAPRRGPGRPRKASSLGQSLNANGGNGDAADNGRISAAPTNAGTRTMKAPSAARARSMKLQGQYLGTIRGLKPRAKAQVKALTKEQGVAAGLELARKLSAQA